MNKKMNTPNLEKLNSEDFTELSMVKLSKLKGGYTLSTVTCTPGGSRNDCSSDGDCAD